MHREKSDLLDLHFMLQKEVVDRLVATPHHKSYGRLSVMVQAHFIATRLFDVAPESFFPVPKIYSSVVRLVPRELAIPFRILRFLLKL